MKQSYSLLVANVRCLALLALIACESTPKVPAPDLELYEGQYFQQEGDCQLLYTQVWAEVPTDRHVCGDCEFSAEIYMYLESATDTCYGYPEEGGQIIGFRDGKRVMFVEADPDPLWVTLPGTATWIDNVWLWEQSFYDWDSGELVRYTREDAVY